MKPFTIFSSFYQVTFCTSVVCCVTSKVLAVASSSKEIWNLVETTLHAKKLVHQKQSRTSTVPITVQYSVSSQSTSTISTFAVKDRIYLISHSLLKFFSSQQSSMHRAMLYCFNRDLWILIWQNAGFDCWFPAGFPSVSSMSFHLICFAWYLISNNWV